MWDTSVNSLMFGRMVDTMRDFFTTVGFITLALGGIGVMNIMLITVKERTREIGIRKALGATTTAVLRQFFLEGFFITMISGTIGLGDRAWPLLGHQPAADAEPLRGHDPVARGRSDDDCVARRHRRG